MKTDFKVYPRKINVFRVDRSTPNNPRLVYAWSTNAYKTCRDAVARAKELHPKEEFKALFD